MIAIGSDHGGFELKEKVKAHLDKNQIAYKDFGAFNTDSVSYVPVAKEVSAAVLSGEYQCGILICGTGIGISMAANKVRGIRAAVCGDLFSVKYTRLHNDANILCMGGRVIGDGLACEIADVFLNTPFEGGRHLDRISALED